MPTFVFQLICYFYGFAPGENGMCTLFPDSHSALLMAQIPPTYDADVLESMEDGRREEKGGRGSKTIARKDPSSLPFWWRS